MSTLVLFKPCKRKLFIKAYYRGLISEYIGIIWLRLKGYRILAHRYRTPLGEIDVIAKKGRVIAFVEIKYRSHLQQALEAITPRQQKRLRRAANFFLAARHRQLENFFHKKSDFDIRFDIVLIIHYKLLHLKNYWGHESCVRR